MPDGGYEVTAGELRIHAGKVDGHADSMGQAVDAANQVMPDGAYGIICQFVPPLFNDVERAAHEALTASRDGLTDNARKLRETADGYEGQDSVGGQRFSGIEGGTR